MSGQSYSPQLLMLAAVLVASATSAAVTSTLVTSRSTPGKSRQAKAKAAGKRAAAPRAAVAFQSPPGSPTKSAGSGAGSGSDKGDGSGSDDDEEEDDMDELQYDTQYIQDAEPDQFNYGESERSQQADIAGHYDDLDESMYEESRAKGEGDDKEDEDEVPANKLKFVTVSEVWSPHEYRWMIIKNYNKDAPHDRRLAFMAHRRIVTSPGSEPVTKLFLRVLSQPLIKVLQATVPPDDRLYEKIPFVPVSNVYTAKSKLHAWLEGARAANGKDVQVAATAALQAFHAQEQPGVAFKPPSPFQIVDDKEAPVAIRGVQLVLDFLADELKEMVATYDALTADGFISYDLLWLYVKPGQLLVHKHPTYSRMQAMRVTRTRYVVPSGDEPAYFQVNADVIEYSGTRMFRYGVKRAIVAFSGPMELEELPLIPLARMPKTVKAELVARGRRFEELAGVQYVDYQGPMYVRENGRIMALAANSRIMVDRANFGKFNPGYPMAQPSNQSMSYQGMDEADTTPMWLQEKDFTDEDYLLMPPIVYGFCLSKKIWGEFLVDIVKPIHFVSNAFDLLVLPEATKDLVMGLVSSHQRHSLVGDMIRGKGNGLVFLLHGAPGIGKTLTAEAIAETLHKPLYSVGVGELGCTPTELEHNLQRALDLAEAWNCVLLLDEADVFMEQRSAHEVERNGLVSIFLRLLEYTSSILFLTSNRVQSLDAAFHSRISLALRYPNLDFAARKTVWNQVLDRIEEKDGDKVKRWRKHIDVDELARVPLNGRRIKGVLRTAHAMAANKGVDLTMDQIRSVLKISDDFHQHLKGKAVNGGLEADDDAELDV